MAQLGLTAPSPFAIPDDTSSVAKKWKEWKSNFSYYIAATGVQSDRQKKSILLYVAGVGVRAHYEQMGIQEDSYEQVLQALDTRFTTMVIRMSRQGLTAPPPFVIPADVHSVLKKWSEWETSFCHYMDATGIRSDEEKKSVLFNVAGTQVQKLYEEMGIPNCSYNKTLKALHSRFFTMGLEGISFKMVIATLFTKRWGYDPDSHAELVDAFCLQLDIVDVKYNRILDSTHGKPNVYIHDFGNVWILSSYDYFEEAKAEVLEDAKRTSLKGFVIVFRGGILNPVIKYFPV